MTQPPPDGGTPQFPRYADPTLPASSPAPPTPWTPWTPPSSPPSQPPGGYPPPARLPYPGGPQHGYPPYPSGPPPQLGQPQRSDRFNRSAIAGFVLSLVGISLLGVIFSAVGLGKIGRTGERGKGLAIAGLVIGLVWVGGLMVAGALLGDDVGDDDRIAVSSLRAGDCFDADIDKTTLITVKTVDCAGEHTAEVYARVRTDLAGMSDGDQEAAATEDCARPFEPFVGKAYDDSTLDVYYIIDDERPGDPGNLICTIVAPEGGASLTGTMRGSGR